MSCCATAGEHSETSYLSSRPKRKALVVTRSQDRTQPMKLSSDIHKRVQDLIKVSCDDTFLSHLKLLFSDRDPETTYGTVKGDSARIWIVSRSIIGVVHPVIRLKIDRPNSSIKLSSKLNSFGLLFTLFVNSLIVYAAARLFLFRPGEGPNLSLGRLIGFIVFIGIFNCPLIFAYRQSRDALAEHLESVLKS